MYVVIEVSTGSPCLMTLFGIGMSITKQCGHKMHIYVIAPLCFAINQQSLITIVKQIIAGH